MSVKSSSYILYESESVQRSVMPNPLRPHGHVTLLGSSIHGILQGKNTEVIWHFHTSPLSEMWFTDIFSWSVCCLLILFKNVFHRSFKFNENHPAQAPLDFLLCYSIELLQFYIYVYKLF